MKREEERKKKFSRRDFVKTTAVGVGASALAGLSAREAEAQGTQGALQYGLVTDVVVVGAGLCGLPAAIEVKRAGLDVLIVEKSYHVGGLGIATSGGSTLGGGTAVQIKGGVTNDTPELMYQDEMYANDSRGVPEIMRTLIARSPEHVLWCEEQGIVWAPIGAGVLRPPIRRGHSRAQMPITVEYPSQTGGWIWVFKKEVERLGIPVLFDHRMTRIHRPHMNGPVVGIEVDTPQGTINIKARKAVILCTGSWVDNYRMIQAWDPRLVGPDCYGDGGTPCDGTLFTDSSGDGLFAAADIGAGFSDMSFATYVYIFYGTRSYWGWDPPDFTKGNNQSRRSLVSNAAEFQRVILVKNDGVRWINEAEGARPSTPGRGGYSENPENPYTATYLSLPQPRNVWAVTDADGVAALNWPEADIRNPNPKRTPMLDPACLAIADTLPQLASMMGIPAATLEATVNRYNGFVGGGNDDDFGKPLPLYKVEKPPFFAAKASLIRHTQRNGLRVNTKSQVLAQSDQLNGYSGRAAGGSVSIDSEGVIPHLYAAGEVGNALGWRRPHNSYAYYILVARIAAENAAREISLA
ncbi:MAG: FAD-binding protein [Acidobacteria bacterium]|nr:FAD-binding protein [Acidobacteriota bacterium]